MSDHGELYARLAAHFDKHHSRPQGGTTLTYVTGEQVISRLNEVLGPDGWSFEVREHGVDEAADEIWVIGRLTAYFPTRRVMREQAGSQKVNRSRGSGTPLDIGFDLKGATTDCLKKCASMFGCGLYLYDKDEMESIRNGRSGKRDDTTQEPRPSARRTIPADPRRTALLKRWQVLWQEAIDLGIERDKLPTIRADVSMPDLMATGAKLKGLVDAAKAIRQAESDGF